MEPRVPTDAAARPNGWDRRRFSRPPRNNPSIGDSLPEEGGTYHPATVDDDRITGVLVRTEGHHSVVAVYTGPPGDELDPSAVFDLDATRRRATRRDRRTVGIVAAAVGSTIQRPVLGYYS